VLRVLHASDLHCSALLSAREYVAQFARRRAGEEGEEADLTAAQAIAHLAIARGASEPLLKMASRAISRWGGAADVLLVTGDIANSGRRADLQRARQFVEEVRDRLRSAAPPADGGGKAASGLVVLPGNHDRYDDRRPPLPGGLRFGELFAEYWAKPPECIKVDRFPCDGGTVRFVSVDLSLRQEDRKAALAGHYYGKGLVRQDLLEHLESATVGNRGDNEAVVWLLHFAPGFPGLPWGLRLENGDALLERASKLNVSHLFCGHTHETRRYRYGDGPEVICSGTPSGTASDGVRAFLLTDLGRKGTRTATERCIRIGIDGVPGSFREIGDVALVECGGEATEES